MLTERAGASYHAVVVQNQVFQDAWEGYRS